ncbi:hypothetical protein Rsub_11194 [Raphidocelis subcapitata]|uniref:Major facilitator superfamily (MFS) profile domain-containing protein n=1 Tax=Raphidocelis subcapitata TaxID=307507 RepID=A0A2V0PDC3_9CHLO|nr:hypothetical protein Rsub_11194 [Raphidocelis subcapitata]|eukprot:GBF97844.1 hypothetical protein Rsub_11194 [Raphidocelis subcapitata]
MAALARVVLDKAALCGLKVAVWDAAASAFVDGVIEDYSPSAGCYIVVGAAARFAVAFQQFTLEEEGEALVLKVTRATPAALPAGYSRDPDAGPEGAGASAGGSAPRSARASAEELSELVGARFAAGDGDSCFQAVSPPPAAGAGGGGEGGRGEGKGEQQPRGAREEAQQRLERLGIAPRPGDSDNEDGGGAGGGGSYWGTPVKGGTPRGGPLEAQGSGAGAGASPAAAAAPRAAGGSLGAALMRRMANFEEISRLISGGGAGAQAQQHAAPPQPQQPPAAGAQGAGSSDGSDLPIAAAVSDAGGGALLPESSSDFAIGMVVDGDAPDVGPRPPSGRSSWRASRSAIDQELAADEVMAAGDGQQAAPGSRRTSRVSARNLGASDGERPLSAGGAGAAAAAGSAQQPPLPGSRRVSRTATRAAGEPSAGGAGNGGGLSGGGRANGEPYGGPGGPLPAPTPGSRRASRTLSGRLPVDQEPPPPAVMAVLDEADGQDVVPRATTAAGAAPSRRASHTTPSGRGTPDSDGFGYSGFEEDAPEPILGLEQAQELQRRSSRLLEALAEAAPAAAEGASGGGGGAGGGAAAAAGAAVAAPVAAPAPRRVSRTVSGLLQAAAAAAESLIGAARGSSAGGGATAAAAAAAAAAEEPVFGGGALGGPAAAARRGIADSFAIASVDSFTCPPMIPFGSPGAGAGSGGSLTFPSPPRADARGAHQQPSPLSQQRLGVGGAPARGRPEAGALGNGGGGDGGGGTAVAGGKPGGGSRLKAAEPTAAAAAEQEDADGLLQIGTAVDGTDAAVFFSSAAGRAAPLTAPGGGDGGRDAAANAIQAQQQRAAPAAAAATAPAPAAGHASAAAPVRAPAEVPGAEAPTAAEPPGLVRRSASGRLPVGEGRQQQEGQGQRQEQGGGSLGGYGGVDGVTLVGLDTYTRYSEIETAPLVGPAPPSDGRPTGQPQAARPFGEAAAALCAAASTAQQHFHGAAFALLGPQVGAAATPEGTPQGAQLVAAFALLAAGHALRPAGALLWPAVARRRSRRAAAGWALALSVFPAALIGALPTYSQAGVASPVLMAALFLVQGLALGSEAGGGAGAAAARGGPRTAGGACLRASLGPAGAALGAFLAAATCAALAAALPAAALARWGWRVPLVGGPLALGVVCVALQLWALRGELEAAGSAHCSDARWLKPALRHGWGAVLGAAALDALPAVTLWLVALALPALREAFAAAAPHDALGGGAAANALLLVGLAPLGGWLADAAGPVPVLLVSAAMAAATAYPALLLSASGAPGAAWLGQLLLLAAGGLFAGAAAGWQAELMPPEARVASLGLAHALGAGIAGGAAPLASAALARSRGAVAGGPAAVVMAAAGISAAACCGLRHRQRRSSP